MVFEVWKKPHWLVMFEIRNKISEFVLVHVIPFYWIPHCNDALPCFLFSQLDYEDTCVNFTIERWYPVANMSRYLPIRVYDYYSPGKESWKSVSEQTTSMYQNPSWESDSSTCSWEIPHILWYQKVYCSLYKNLPSCYFKNQFNIILPSVPRSFKWPLTCRFPHWNPLKISVLLHMYQLHHPFYVVSFWSDIRMLRLQIMVYQKSLPKVRMVFSLYIYSFH